jgi:hypothetical protein
MKISGVDLSCVRTKEETGGCESNEDLIASNLSETEKEKENSSMDIEKKYELYYHNYSDIKEIVIKASELQNSIDFFGLGKKVKIQVSVTVEEEE